MLIEHFGTSGLTIRRNKKPRMDTIADAQKWIETLLQFTRRKLMEGWDYEKAERAEVAGDLMGKRWSDLAIGIDDDGTYRVFSSCPVFGARVNVMEALHVFLPGERWRKLLTCFARSEDGRTAMTDELILELRYMQKGDIRHGQAVFDDELREEGKKGYESWA